MERLTYRLNDQCDNPTDSIILKPYLRYEDTETRKKILNRLAAYEDTGLEPEDVRRLQQDWTSLIMTLDEMGGMPNLHDLVQAEKDGRLVVLPCKAGSLIYVGRRPAIITRFFGYVSERYFHAVFFDENKGIDIPFEELGKTVFLTREEAEAALKGGDSPENRTDRR